jgi:hypothetical protein
MDGLCVSLFWEEEEEGRERVSYRLIELHDWV